MKPLYLISLFVLIGACGQSADDQKSADDVDSQAADVIPYEAPPPSSSYEEAFAAAVEAIDHSAERGHAWVTADQLLEQAVAAADDGDKDSAMQLADRARIQAELALLQADVEESTWRGRVLSE